MSGPSLSPALRKQYEDSLSDRGLMPALAGSGVVYFILAYGVGYAAPVGSVWRMWGTLGAFIIALLIFRRTRASQARDQRRAAEAMPDDQLANAYELHAKTVQQSGLLWALALGGLAFGLLFTPQGNDLLDTFIVGFNP